MSWTQFKWHQDRREGITYDPATIGTDPDVEKVTKSQKREKLQTLQYACWKNMTFQKIK
jgi:hypothetical protein